MLVSGLVDRKDRVCWSLGLLTLRIECVGLWAG